MPFKPSRAKKVSPEDAQSEVDAYQSLVGNILMMGTLIFGFCVTGTFLSVSFTGEEAWPTGDDDSSTFIDFLRFGCYAAISSLTATLIAFTFSTRVANQQIHSGPLAAYRTVQLTTCFIVLAEMLLYMSLDHFMQTIWTYTQLEYQGPQICPSSLKEERIFYDYTSSFCAQAGDEMYQTAQALCGHAQDPSPLVVRGATCTAYDFYTDLYWHWADSGFAALGYLRIPNATQGFYNYVNASAPTWWFGWDWSDTGYMDQDIPKQAFFKVINELADKACGKDDAQIALTGLCTNEALSTSACAQARSAYLQADACSGGKQDDAMKCRKVCQWVQDDEGPGVPIKLKINKYLNFWMTLMQWVIRVTTVFRLLAGVVQVVKNLKELWQDGDARMVFFFDFWGVCDALQGPEEEEESEDESIDKRQLILAA